MAPQIEQQRPNLDPVGISRLGRRCASRASLDPARRLTGDLKGASGWVRTVAAAPEDRRAAQLQDLMTGIGVFQRDANALGPGAAAVLARHALRIDPESVALRDAATGLQRIADTWTSADAETRRQALDAAASGVAAAATKALATAPLRATAPNLAGSFRDALRTPGGGR